MVKNNGLRDDLKIGANEKQELSSEQYFAPQSGGPRGYSMQFDDDDRDPWDYDDYRDDDEEDEDDYLKDDDFDDDDSDDADDDLDDKEPMISNTFVSEAEPEAEEEAEEEMEEEEEIEAEESPGSFAIRSDSEPGTALQSEASEAPVPATTAVETALQASRTTKQSTKKRNKKAAKKPAMTTGMKIERPK